jgi:hypothetical protein
MMPPASRPAELPDALAIALAGLTVRRAAS